MVACAGSPSVCSQHAGVLVCAVLVWPWFVVLVSCWYFESHLGSRLKTLPKKPSASVLCYALLCWTLFLLASLFPALLPTNSLLACLSFQEEWPCVLCLVLSCLVLLSLPAPIHSSGFVVGSSYSTIGMSYTAIPVFDWDDNFFRIRNKKIPFRFYGAPLALERVFL